MLKRREGVKDLFCMGSQRKPALGPNPLASKRKQSRKIKKAEKPRRKRKGKRSKLIS
jgi:hypothetical protein